MSDFLLPPICNCGGLITGIIGSLKLECMTCKRKFMLREFK